MSPVPSAVSATLVPRPHTRPEPIVEQRTAHGRLALLLDPVGSVPFRGGKPRRWLATAPLDDWPPDRFVIECELCPQRGSSAPALLSYAPPGAPPLVVYEQRAGGVTIELGGHTVVSGVFLDYAQWQRLAIEWDRYARTLRLYKDDGAVRVEAEGAGEPPPPLGAPVFEHELAAGARVEPGGTLVLGQLQRRPGVIADFDLERGFRGAVAELRVWREPPDFTLAASREPGEDSAVLFARWRFSALGIELGDALAAPGSPAAILGGFAAGDLRDVHLLRLIATDGRRAGATAPVLELGREQRVELALEQTELAVAVDGRTLQCQPLAPGDAQLEDHRGLRVGALDQLTSLELRAPSGAVLARYHPGEASGRTLADLSGRGLDLGLGS